MKPILFNSEMVIAILDGRKTVTRRVVKPQPPSNTHPNLFVTQPYRLGEILYVRETWTVWNGNYEYKADVESGYGPFCSSCTLDICAGYCNSVLKWRPSIHMPREAARIFLRVTDVRVERLQKISIDEMRADGIQRENIRPTGCSCVWRTETCMSEPCKNRDSYEYMCWAEPFSDIWDSTIKPADKPLYGWGANPWVWVIEFERISKEEAGNG